MPIKLDAADIQFSKAIRMNRHNTCEHCKQVQNEEGYPKMECAHIYGRANKSTRWDTLNALCLCHTCHRYFTANPLDFHTWLAGYVGQGYIDILNEKRQRIFKTNKVVRKEIAAHYREQVKLLEAGRHDLVSYQ